MPVAITAEQRRAARMAAQAVLARARTENAAAGRTGARLDHWRGVAERLARLIMSLTETDA